MEADKYFELTLTIMKHIMLTVRSLVKVDIAEEVGAILVSIGTLRGSVL